MDNYRLIISKVSAPAITSNTVERLSHDICSWILRRRRNEEKRKIGETKAKKAIGKRQAGWKNTKR